ncbi:MAG: hypothetical protein ACRDZ7_00710 [Acidimicrobiia bacterium]
MTENVPASDAQLVPVTHHVPVAVVLAFQRHAPVLIERLLAGQEPFGPAAPGGEPVAGPSGFQPLPYSEAHARHPDVWSLADWGSAGDDDGRARWLVGDLNYAKPRLLTKALVTNRGELTSQDLADGAGYGDYKAIPPALRHLASRCRQVERRPFWHFHHREDGTGVYTAGDAVRALFAPLVAEIGR